jgi:hypothetical protein
MADDRYPAMERIHPNSKMQMNPTVYTIAFPTGLSALYVPYPTVYEEKKLVIVSLKRNNQRRVLTVSIVKNHHPV